MLVRAALPLLSIALPLLAACAHTETVVHLSAPNDAAWEVRDTEGSRLCALPCTVELEDREAVAVARSDGGTEFWLRQENLGPGDFSGSVRMRRERTSGSLAAQVVSGALVGAGNALVKNGDEDHQVAGAVLAGIGAVVLAASDASRSRREELWVERTSTPQ